MTPLPLGTKVLFIPEKNYTRPEIVATIQWGYILKFETTTMKEIINGKKFIRESYCYWVSTEAIDTLLDQKNFALSSLREMNIIQKQDSIDSISELLTSPYEELRNLGKYLQALEVNKKKTEKRRLARRTKYGY